MSNGSRRGAGGAEVAAQCKVNLRLAVLAREAGGYHQLETLFLRLALADTVRVRRTPAATTLDVSGVPAGVDLGPVERNLAWRAAQAYAQAAEWRGGFAIEVEKRIPVGGGLGGGSADAGAVLRALDALATRPLGEAALLRIAATLGADVPFLTASEPYALAWGRGERMLALDPPDEREVLLVVPPVAVNTAAAFGWLAAAREGEVEGGEGMLLQLDALSDWDSLSVLASNDFDAVIVERHPEITRLVFRMREAGFALAMMSGSGSVVYGVCGPRQVAASMVLPGDEPGPARNVRVATRTATRVEPVRLLD